MLKASNTKALLLLMEKENKKIDDWVDTIPSDIDIAFCDNTYVNSLVTINLALIKELFGDLYDDVYWFLYECNERCYEITVDGKVYNIHSVDDYINYLVSEHLIEDDS